MYSPESLHVGHELDSVNIRSGVTIDFLDHPGWRLGLLRVPERENGADRKRLGNCDGPTMVIQVRGLGPDSEMLPMAIRTANADREHHGNPAGSSLA
jgi:hypothetical protein